MRRFPSPQVGSEHEVKNLKGEDEQKVSIPSSRVGTKIILTLHPASLLVSIPSSRVGTRVPYRWRSDKANISIPSSRVGTNVRRIYAILNTLKISIPSSRVGTRSCPARGKATPKFPSPQVGSEQLEISFRKNPKGFYFHPLKSGRNAFCICNAKVVKKPISIPSSRVGTNHSAFANSQHSHNFHPLKSGRNLRVSSTVAAVVAGFPSPQVGSEPPRERGRPA